jgi:protein involved in temperature-dependent protein secretion
MSAEYSIQVLKDQRNKLDDKLNEISEGAYNKYPQENIKRLKTNLIQKLHDLQFAIEALETYKD